MNRLRFRSFAERPLSGRVYDALKSATSSGELSPATQLTESGAAQNLGARPTPVRELFHRLAEKCLLDIDPGAA